MGQSKKLGAAAAILALGCSATAASAQEEFTQVWEGFYAGLHLDATNFTTDNADLNNQFNSNAPEQSALVASGGLTFGYNWELEDGFILGLEFDYTSELRIEEFVSSNVAETTGTQVNNVLESIVSIRGRAGVQSGNVLGYVSGGIASGASLFETYQVNTGGGQTSCSNSTCAETKEAVIGVSIAAGTEYAFREDIIGRLEVQHYSFDDVSAPVLDASGDAACASGATDLCSVIYSPSATAVKLSVIYKF